MSEPLDWAEDDPKMIELSELAEIETYQPKPCICGKHVFKQDELAMGSMCPQCFASSDGTPHTNIQQRAIERECKQN